MSVRAEARLVPVAEILPLRDRYREEMNCQITHDSIPTREGWTLAYLCNWNGAAAGYGLVAVAGPWKEKPTIIEFYVYPEQRTVVFDLFEAFLAASDARFIEIQTNASLLTVMLHTWSQEVMSEKIVFQDYIRTSLPANGAMFRRTTSLEESRACVERRQGSSDWLLEFEGSVVAKGGIAFHYNRPYGDIYMEVLEPFRRRGFGSYFVQELKRISYEELESIPCARCSPDNVASRQTLQKAGFIPCAHILVGSIGRPGPGRR